MSRVEDEYWEKQKREADWSLARQVYILEQRVKQLEFIIGYHNLQVKIPDPEKPFSSAHEREKKSH